MSASLGTLNGSVLLSLSGGEPVEVGTFEVPLSVVSTEHVDNGVKLSVGTEEGMSVQASLANALRELAARIESDGS